MPRLSRKKRIIRDIEKVVEKAVKLLEERVEDKTITSSEISALARLAKNAGVFKDVDEGNGELDIPVPFPVDDEED